MRILHIGEYVKAGIATYLRELIAYQTKQNCEVFLCMSDYVSELEFPLKSENIIRYPYLRTPKKILFAIYFIWKTIKHIKPDIIHIHSSFAGAFVRISLFIFPIEHPKVIYCAHGWSFVMDVPYWKKKIYSLIEQTLAYKTDLIINTSKHEQEKAFLFGIPQDKCILIYNGLSEDEKVINKNDELIIDSDLHSESIKLLFVGRFDHQKGVDILLKLFEEKKFPDIELILIGDSVLNNGEKINIPRGIKHLGWVDARVLEKYYKLCDAVIMPSRWEGFSLVALGALKNKKALIASKVASLPEVVIDNITGKLFNIDDLEELSAILYSLDKEKLSAMGEAGYKLYKEKFTSDVMNLDILRTYRQLLE